MNRLDSALNGPAAPASGEGSQGGCFVVIVGPSGAGKDTLLRGVADVLAGDHRFVFARRIITRACDGTEDHDCISEAEFTRLKEAEAFLLCWSANGLSYGLPGDLKRDLAGGRYVVANVSRAALPDVRERFVRHLIVHVTATPEVLARRLAARGREDAAQQQARLARALQHDRDVNADAVIDNSDDLAGSLAQFEQVLRGLVCDQALAR